MGADDQRDLHRGPPLRGDRQVEMRYRVASSAASRRDTARRTAPLPRAPSAKPHGDVHALNELSLVVERGESVGIIGRNGSGKSTLMKIIGGQIKPTTGAVYASSTPIMLGVNAALVQDLSGDQNVVSAASPWA